MCSRDTVSQEIPLRENLVKTAVQFLKNPKVSASPAEHKEEFLKRKGLTEEEIKAAFKTIEQTYSFNGYTAINIPPVNKVQEYIAVNRAPTRYERFKDVFNITALIGATAFFVYWFYKKVVVPFIASYKKSNVSNAVYQLDRSLQNSMKEIKESMTKLEGDVKKLSEDRAIDPTIPQLVQELKQDLASLKSLLLSRKQFPSAPAAIPSWQLDRAGTSQEKPIEREDDAGSGSSTNNSDSSLEMIRDEPPPKE